MGAYIVCAIIIFFIAFAAGRMYERKKSAVIGNLKTEPNTNPKPEHVHTDSCGYKAWKLRAEKYKAEVEELTERLRQANGACDSLRDGLLQANDRLRDQEDVYAIVRLFKKIAASAEPRIKGASKHPGY